MKPSIWDILTGFTLFGILIMIGVFGYILTTPPQPINSVVAGEHTIPTISIPTATITNVPQQPTATFTITPTRRPWVTSTPMSTNTPFVLPTFTKAPRKSSSGGGGGGLIDCLLKEQKPVDDEYMLKNAGFDMYWKVTNVSTQVWAKDSIDLRWISGDSQVLKTNKIIDLEYDVSPKSDLDIKIPMYAPEAGGSYTSYWGLFNGDKAICRFFIRFQVSGQ